MAIVFTAAAVVTYPVPHGQSSAHVGEHAIVSFTGPVTIVSDGNVCDLSDIFANAVESVPGSWCSADGLYTVQYHRGTDGDPETGYFTVTRNSTGLLLSGGVTFSAQNFRMTLEGR